MHRQHAEPRQNNIMKYANYRITKATCIDIDIKIKRYVTFLPKRDTLLKK